MVLSEAGVWRVVSPAYALGGILLSNGFRDDHGQTDLGQNFRHGMSVVRYTVDSRNRDRS